MITYDIKRPAGVLLTLITHIMHVSLTTAAIVGGFESLATAGHSRTSPLCEIAKNKQ